MKNKTRTGRRELNKGILLGSLCMLGILGEVEAKKHERPNVILIMADDMGYECVGANGSTSYTTPNIDKIAHHGVRFTHCISQPLCTPSRVKLMTGQRNYTNYEHFGYLNVKEKTFGNVMQEAGYKTCIAGKWQLNGLAYKDEITDWNDSSKPNKLGFDEYCLWQLSQHASLGGRYANPLIEQNGELLKRDAEAYGPNIFSEFVLDFIDKNKDEPFFIYYPMVLVHDPFVPTPDSEGWINQKLRRKNNKAYFNDMVSYTDKIVGKIIQKLKDNGLYENTIVIFTGDNGTHRSIVSQTKNRPVKGGKGLCTNAGTHVPLLIQFPQKIKQGFVHEGLIEFCDFYATIAEITGVKVKTDGISFKDILSGKDKSPREVAIVHYEPRWGWKKHKNTRFARTVKYKLYNNGFFYDLEKDCLEEHPLPDEQLSNKARKTKKLLQKKLDELPVWKH